jgi:hypothetical protein
VVNSGCEVDLGGLEWVVGWKVYGKEEDAALEWTIALQCGIVISHLVFRVVTIETAIGRKTKITYWTHNCSLPMKLRKTTNVSIDLRHIPSHSIGAVSRIGIGLPDRLPSVLRSMMKAGP